MAIPALAIGLLAGGAGLGALSGFLGSKSAKKPTVTKNHILGPPAALGGYDRIVAAMNAVRDRPGYTVGQSNPYLHGGMQHIFGRAGMQTPEGGYGPNPYLEHQKMLAEKAAGPQPGAGLPPEVLEQIRRMMEERAAAGQGVNPPPGTAGGP